MKKRWQSPTDGGSKAHWGQQRDAAALTETSWWSQQWQQTAATAGPAAPDLPGGWVWPSPVPHVQVWAYQVCPASDPKETKLNKLRRLKCMHVGAYCISDSKMDWKMGFKQVRTFIFKNPLP